MAEKRTKKQFRAELRKQLGFLNRSAAAYDDGSPDEAIRIAGVIRCLMHQGRSPSLLQHLGFEDIPVTSSTRGASPSTFMFDGLCALVFKGGSSEPPGVRPRLGDCPDSFLMRATDWWEQVVIVGPHGRLRRRDLVLNAADKDGFAHVDSKLTDEYEQLMRFYRTRVGDGPEEDAPIHLAALRQLAWELQNSKPLILLSLRELPPVPPRVQS